MLGRDCIAADLNGSRICGQVDLDLLAATLKRRDFANPLQRRNLAYSRSRANRRLNEFGRIFSAQRSRLCKECGGERENGGPMDRGTRTTQLRSGSSAPPHGTSPQEVDVTAHQTSTTIGCQYGTLTFSTRHW
jgi:hypothetical protein